MYRESKEAAEKLEAESPLTSRSQASGASGPNEEVACLLTDLKIQLDALKNPQVVVRDRECKKCQRNLLLMNKLSTQVDDSQSIIKRQDTAIIQLKRDLAGVTDDLEFQKKLVEEIKEEKQRQQIEIVKQQTKAEQLERCLEFIPQPQHSTSELSSR